MEPSTRAQMEQYCRGVAQGQKRELIVANELRRLLRQFSAFVLRTDDFCSLVELGIAEGQEAWSSCETSPVQRPAYCPRWLQAWKPTTASADAGAPYARWPRKLPHEDAWLSKVPPHHLRLLGTFREAKRQLASDGGGATAASEAAGPALAQQEMEEQAWEQLAALQRDAAALHHKAAGAPRRPDELSRMLAFHLRHNEELLSATEDGWCKLEDVLPLLVGYTENDVQAVVRESTRPNGQKRFELYQGLIRAKTWLH